MRPREISTLIWIILLILVLLCMWVPEEGFRLGHTPLRWPTLSQAWVDFASHSVRSADTLQQVEKQLSDTGAYPLPPTNKELLALAEQSYREEELVSSPVVPSNPPTPQAVTAEPNLSDPEDTKTTKTTATTVTTKDTKDSRMYLSAFYASLPQAAEQTVRIMHYGDSQIEEDRITSMLREKMQTAYGGGGVGLIPLYQTIPTLTLQQTTKMNNLPCSMSNSPKRYLVYGPKAMRRENAHYGVMGQVAIMDDEMVDGSEDISIRIEPTKLQCFSYFSRVRLITDVGMGQVRAEGDNTFALFDNETMAELPDSTTTCEIRLQGSGEIYGISLETPTGVIVDNIPMRGCSGVVFTKIDSAQLASFYAETNTRLIILQYGGNMIPFNTEESTIRGYVRQLGEQVSYLQRCAPEASILFIGPSDMATRINGEIQSYPLVSYMDEQLCRMAEKKGIAYWSLFHAMGGEGSMIEYVEQGLAGNDYVHFTRRGARVIGEKLWKWLEEGRGER